MAQTALVVDDSEIARAFIMDILQRHEFELIMEAENGAQCVEIVRRNPPDVIFLDIEMPVMNGIEALRAIRRFHKHITIVMMTAVADTEVVKECKQHGTDYYILKDLPEDKIDQRIGQILGRVRGHSQVWPRSPYR